MQARHLRGHDCNTEMRLQRCRKEAHALQGGSYVLVLAHRGAENAGTARIYPNTAISRSECGVKRMALSLMLMPLHLMMRSVLERTSGRPRMPCTPHDQQFSAGREVANADRDFLADDAAELDIDRGGHSVLVDQARQRLRFGSQVASARVNWRAMQKQRSLRLPSGGSLPERPFSA